MLFHITFCFSSVKIKLLELLCCEFIMFMRLHLSFSDKCFMVFFFLCSGYGTVGVGGLGGGQAGAGFGGYGGGY